MTTSSKGPVRIDLDADAPAPAVTEAAPIPDLGVPPEGAVMQSVARLAARRPSRLVRWFWGLTLGLLGAVISISAWDFVIALLARAPVLGWVITALIGALLLVVLILGLRELAGFARLSRIGHLRRDAGAARADRDLGTARNVAGRLTKLYSAREEMHWARSRLAELQDDAVDAHALLDLVEAELMSPLDQMALREVEAAARQVATVTALVPLALADVVAAFSANLRMIRRVAEVYGGRSGLLGSWRLTRAVMTHLVATGAVAVGDDLLEPLLGGSILSKLSRRFGEGLVNGALTARVGIAAMEVCRPLPFSARKKPAVRSVVTAALSGLITK